MQAELSSSINTSAVSAMQENADLAESHTRTNHTLVRHVVPATQGIRTLAVDEQYRNPKLIDARRTMATKFFGEHVGSLVFRITKKTRVCAMLLVASSWLLWLLCYLGILPSEIGWLALAGVLSSINFWALANPYILKKLLFNFDVWYISIHATLALVGMLDISMYDGKGASMILWWWHISTATFLDASHVSAHKYNAVYLAIGSVGTAIFIPCIYFGVFPNLRSRFISIGLPTSKDDESRISIHTIFFTVDRMTTVVLFLSKNLWNTVRHPNYYINIKARVKCEKVTAEKFEIMKRKSKMSVRELSFVGGNSLQQNMKQQKMHTAGAKGDIKHDVLHEKRNGPDPSTESSQHEEHQKREVVLTELNGLSLGDDDLVRVMMVEQDFMGFVIIDASDTLVSKLFGKSKGDWVFARIKKTGHLFLQLWVAALILSTLGLFAVVPDWVGYISFSISIPFFLSFWALCNPHRVVWLGLTFEIWYLATLSTTAIAFAIYIFEHDGCIFSLIFIWLCTIPALFFDAAHVSLAKYAKFYFVFAIGWYLTFIVSLHLGGFPSMNNRDLSPSLFGVKVNFNVAALVTDKLVIVVLFFCKNVCNAIIHPGSYVILKARLKHEKMRVVELRGILQNKAGSSRRRLFRQEAYLNKAVVAPDPVSPIISYYRNHLSSSSSSSSSALYVTQ
jgi:hypothetical protein